MPSSSNVYFGKLRAAHVDDPHGGCGAHDGPLLQGSPHVHVRNRPLVREHDLPPCAGRPDHEPAVHCFVGTGGGSATKTIKRGRGQGAPHHKVTHTGDPVDVATGRVFHDVFEFAAPALPGFPFERSCGSHRAGEDGPLGWGWAHSFDQRLEHDAEGVTLHDAVGRRVLFPPLGLGEAVQHLDEKITLAQGDEGEFILERPDGLSLFFVDKMGTGLARLETVFDEGGMALLLEYEGQSLRHVSDSLGNVYRIESEDGRHWHAIVQEGDEDAPEQTLCRYQYDREGHLAAAGDALGQWWRYGYDHARRLARNTDRNGFSFFFEYDDAGRCARTRGEDGLYDLSFTYLQDPARTIERDAQGRTTTYEYTDLGLVSRVTDAGGHAETFTYEGADQVAHEDALGRTTRYEYDPEGRVTARTAPGGGRSLVTHDEGGLASVTDAEGGAMARTLTPDGRLLVTSPASPTPLLTARADPDEDCLVLADGAGAAARPYLDGAGRPPAAPPPAPPPPAAPRPRPPGRRPRRRRGGGGAGSRLYLDEAGRLLAAETPLGRTLAAGYDAQGNLGTLADGAGRAVRFAYDPLGRLIAVEREGGTGLSFAYDAEGELTHFTDGAGAVTRFDFRGFQQLRAVTTPAGNVTRFDYDEQGRLHRLADARGSAWQFDYDRAGRLERLLHPEGASETFAYDAAGQVRRRVSRGGAGFDYDYDADGSLIAIRCGDGTTLSFAYDHEGRLIGACGPGSSLTFEYDGLGRLIRETQDGQAVGYAYDGAGRLSRMTTPAGDTILYAYDADGALSGVTDWEGGRHAFVYGEDGAMLSARSPNGVLARFDYSALGLPSAVHLGRGGEEAPLARIALSFDGRDALTEAADSALGRSRYAYDADGRLAEASGAAPERFEYDAAGNLVGHGRHEWEYDSANRLVGTTDAHFRYDGDGNLVEDDGPDGRRRFAYDALGLLARADLPGGAVAEYAHDPLGRRTVKRVTSGRGAVTETRWLWAGDGLLSETVTDGDGEPLERRDFLFAPGSFAPLAQRVGGAVFCCHTDPRGAPTRLTDGRGRVAWAASYSAYGEARVRTGSLRQPLRLPGQYHDAETGLHQNRWRCYDPRRGRYLSPDPFSLLGGVNLYSYAQNDPVGQSDPLGLFPSIEALAGHLLPPQAMQRFQQVRRAVSQALLPHLGPLRRYLPPAAPRPPAPAMSLAHPAHHLPPAPATRSAAHGPAPHRAPAHQAPPPARGAHACPKALAAQKSRAAHGAAHGAAPDDAAHRTVWQNVGPDLLTVGRGIAHLPAVAGTSLKALAFGAGNMAQKYGNGFLEGAEWLTSLGDQGTDRATDLAAKKGYDDAANRAEAREKTAMRPLMDTFSALTPGTLKDVTAAAADLAGGQPGEAKRVLESIVPNTERAFHDAPVQTSLNGLVVLGGAGRVLSKAGDLAGAGRVGAGLSKAGEAAQSAASGGPVGRAVRAGVGRAASAGLRRLSPAKQAAVLRGMRAAQAAQARRAGGPARPAEGRTGPAPAHEPGERHTDASIQQAQDHFNAQRDAAKAEAQANILRQRRPAHATMEGQQARAAGVSEAGKLGSHPIGTRAAGMSLIQRMAAKAKGEVNPDLPTRINSHRNLKTQKHSRPAPVQPPVSYWDFDLAKKAREFRKNYVNPDTGEVGYWGTSNVVVFEYKGLRDVEGNLPTVAVKSIRQQKGVGAMHSEPIALLELEKRGISLSDVTRVYSERAPCVTSGNYCSALLDQELNSLRPEEDPLPIFYTFEYGETTESMAAGNAELVKALNRAQKESK